MKDIPWSSAVSKYSTANQVNTMQHREETKLAAKTVFNRGSF